MLETVIKIKTKIRIRHHKLDEEIEDEIQACLSDLKTTIGIKDPKEDDPLILNAIKLWCCATYETDASKSAEFWHRYNELKGSLSFASGYGGASDE